MNFLFNLINEIVAGLLLLIVTPVLISRRKPILNYVNRKLEKWYNEFIITIAKKDRYTDAFRISLVLAIVIVFAIIVPFKKYENKFEELKSEFNDLKTVNDSLYNRVKNHKLKFTNYEDEVKDINRAIGHKERTFEFRKTTTQIALDEREQIPQYNSAMLFLTGMYFFVDGSLLFIASGIFFLFFRIRMRDSMIKDFEWKLIRLKATESAKDLLDYEVEWSNMKSGAAHNNLIKKINDLLPMVA